MWLGDLRFDLSAVGAQSVSLFCSGPVSRALSKPASEQSSHRSLPRDSSCKETKHVPSSQSGVEASKTPQSYQLRLIAALPFCFFWPLTTVKPLIRTWTIWWNSTPWLRLRVQGGAESSVRAGLLPLLLYWGCATPFLPSRMESGRLPPVGSRYGQPNPTVPK